MDSWSYFQASWDLAPLHLIALFVLLLVVLALRRAKVEKPGAIISLRPSRVVDNDRVVIFDFDGVLTSQESCGGSVRSAAQRRRIFGGAERLELLEVFLEELSQSARLGMVSRNQRAVIQQALGPMAQFFGAELIFGREDFELAVPKSQVIETILERNCLARKDLLFIDDMFLNVSDVSQHCKVDTMHVRKCGMDIWDFEYVLTWARNAMDVRGAAQNWVLDCLSLHERTGRRSLLALAEALVIPKAEALGTTERTMRRFVSEIHRKYEEHQNPFHNEAHAAVVCHSTHWLGMRSKSYQHMGANLHVATDIAALAHDVGHFGRNNAFCTSASHDLALRYNDRAILENMHSATCFQIMKNFGCDILAQSSRENRRQYRDHIVSLILATDMATHFEFLGKFRVRAACSEFNLQDNAEDRRLVTHCYLKAADLGHAALPFEMHERWAFRLLNEFYEQGDEERSLGIPVSPMCERSGNVADFRESQKGFLQFVIQPLFKELVTVSAPEVSETCLTRIEVNAEEWIKGEPNEELVQIIKAPAKPVKTTITTLPVSPKRRLNKMKKAGSVGSFGKLCGEAFRSGNRHLESRASGSFKDAVIAKS
ncbi:unnamed protein product [Effrenium voratum]|nr:unnamed protein product [Effrenium voratum]